MICFKGKWGVKNLDTEVLRPAKDEEKAHEVWLKLKKAAKAKGE